MAGSREAQGADNLLQGSRNQEDKREQIHLLQGSREVKGSRYICCTRAGRFRGVETSPAQDQEGAGE